jgi:hypothetical protein
LINIISDGTEVAGIGGWNADYLAGIFDPSDVTLFVMVAKAISISPGGIKSTKIALT